MGDVGRGSSVAGGAALAVRDLRTIFETRHGDVVAVDGVSFNVARGEVLGIVGESGSGKTTLGRSLMRLVPAPGRITSGEIVLDGTDVLGLSDDAMRKLRGSKMSMIFQNPMRALHPAFTVGWQLREALDTHQAQLGAAEARAKIVEMLSRVGVPDAARRLDDYPHQFSGGMQQRVMIAMSLINSPTLLVADEPTTALDVTIQAQILALLRALVAEEQMSVILITHNLGVVASVCDRVIVMYAGQAVEESTVYSVFERPLHPYTQGLLDSLPERRSGRRLRAIPGNPPRLDLREEGCRFRERCVLAEEICAVSPELLELADGHHARCWVAARTAERTSGGAHPVR